ncbi:MAG: MarR family winged helix-turn-helix transcriptional regulator [Pseudomonadota bacterium]
MTEETERDALQLQDFLTFRLAKVQARLNAQAIRILKDTAGISLSQWRVIAVVGAGGENTVLAADIKRVMGYDKGLFSRTLHRLIEQGFVTSQTDTGDQRRQALALTETGKALFDRTLPIMQARQHSLRSALEQDELDALCSGLEKLEAEVDRQGQAA